MRFEQLKTLLSSLRFRLTAWNTAVVLAMVIVTLVALREGLRLTLQHETKMLLDEDASEIAAAIESFYPDQGQIRAEMDRKVRAHSDRDLFVELLNPDGSILWKSHNAPPLAGFDVGQRLALVGEFLVAQRRLASNKLPPYIVRVGSSIAMIEQDVAKLTRLIVYAGIGALFIAPLGGYWLAGRATHPLARIITTASRLRPRYLDERLPIRGTGDELDRLSLTINRFLDRIGDYLDRNREFVANAAHELRSPLAALQSSVEVTLNCDRTVQEYQDLLCEIAEQCGQLRILINQLLLLAETDGLGAEVASSFVRLDQVVERSLDMFRGAAEERGIELQGTLTASPVVRGDETRLRQVVNNLIDNSLKFTPRGGTVQVTLQFDDHRQQTNLTVSDTGCGIDPADLPHVFERFYRGDKSRQRAATESGNGLGLSICQAIVNHLGGTIDVASQPGHGCCFTVCLPARRQELDVLPAPDAVGATR